MKPLYIPVLAALLCVAPCASAQPTEATSTVTKAPGAVQAVQSMKTTATVTAIDPASRAISLQRPDGQIVDVRAGAEVKNFDKIKVGDKVAVDYTQSLSLELKKGATGAPKRIESPTTVSRASGSSGSSGTSGDSHASATIGEKVTVLADVVAVNRKAHSVRLRGPEGRMVDLKVPDPEQLKQIKQGDQVQAVYTEALALKLEPAGASTGK
jgi:Cu/Ag efflux protein CusF